MAWQIFDNRRDVADPIPSIALLWLAIGLVLSAVPFFGNVPFVALLAVCGLAFWRYRIQITGGRLPATWVRLSLFVTAIGLNLLVYRTIFNMDAAMVLLLVLVGLKLLELRTERDFNLVAYLCYFLVLAALFYNMSLPLFLFQLAVIISITSALVRLHVGESIQLRLGEALVRAGVIFFQAVPLIALLYVVFPRVGGSFGGGAINTGDQSGSTGMSDSLSPGSLASISFNDDPVLRASFPDSDIPRNRDLYWRGVVLTRCRGFYWEQGNVEPTDSRFFDVEGQVVKQRITMEPHGHNWIFALDRPVGMPPKSSVILAGEYIQSHSKVNSVKQYDVTSKIGAAMGQGDGLDWRERRDNLEAPINNLPPRVRELAESWREDAVDREKLIRAVFNFAEDKRPWQQPASDQEVQRLTQEWTQASLPVEEVARRAMAYAVEHGWKVNPDNRERILRDRLREWISYSIDGEKLLATAYAWFRQQGFRYTTSPGVYEENLAGLDRFLFEGRKGYCEHYSGALGLLLRAAGIPARVILGYQGGIYNRMGNLMLVRQGDAHAWNEVWIEGKGWLRVDLTSTIAPDRVEFGMDAFRELESIGATGASERIAALARFSTRYGITQAWRDVRFAVDAVDYYWNLYVLSYDETEQRRLASFMSPMLTGKRTVFKLLILAFCGCVILMALGLALMAFTQRPPAADATHRAYAELRQRLSRAGVPVFPTDGPLALADRATAHLPAQADFIRRLFHTYVRARYSPDPIPAPDLANWRKDIRRLKVR